MYLTPTRIGNAIVGLLILAVFAVLILKAGSGSNHRTPIQTSSPTVPATTPTVTTTTPATVPVKTTPINPPTTTEPPAKPANLLREQKLTAQVAGYLRSYYLVLPRDTAATRRRRLRAITPTRLLNKLDLSLGKNSLADKARRRQKLTVRGSAVLGQLIAEPAAGNRLTLTVTVPVALKELRPGKSTTYSKVLTTSVWQYRAGKWHILSFHQGGGG